MSPDAVGRDAGSRSWTELRGRRLLRCSARYPATCTRRLCADSVEVAGRTSVTTALGGRPARRDPESRQPLAYPAGRYNRTVEAAVQQAGYRSAMGTERAAAAGPEQSRSAHSCRTGWPDSTGGRRSRVAAAVLASLGPTDPNGAQLEASDWTSDFKALGTRASPVKVAGSPAGEISR